MSRIWCRMGRTSLAATVLDRGSAPGWMAAHVGRCLTCQALVANARRLRRDLAMLPPVAASIESTAAVRWPGGVNWKWAGAALITFVIATLRARAEGSGNRTPSFLSPEFAVYSGFRRTP